ncbi:MAG TPA: BON domain-containing protein [Thermoanaerobaculia bacterium]|nr:BON domain-containing protein [Thermoanaerobaculia bacterium]
MIFERKNTERQWKLGSKRLATVALGAGLVFAACSTTQPVGVQVGDSATATKIAAKLAADPEVNPFNVDVDVNEGVVRLSGTVEDPEAKVQAERLARDTAGVRRVINEIELGDRSLGERIDDAGLTAKIKAKLTADPDINPFNINVDVEDGRVTLMGRVKDEWHRQHAEEIVRNTKGVESVRNRLEVGKLGEH